MPRLKPFRRIKPPHVTDKEWHLMLHAYGCNAVERKKGFGYRNHFVASERGDDFPCWRGLVARSLAVDQGKSDTVSAFHTFHLTEAGKALIDCCEQVVV